MNRLKKILATVLSVMLVLTSITLPALANNSEESDQPIEPENVALGKPVITSRASAGIAGYTDTATITDGKFFAEGNGQYITYGPSLITVDLEGSYSVSKVVIDSVTTNFTKDIDVYLSASAANGTAIPSSATKILSGDSNGWAESIKMVELDEAAVGRYVIFHMTSNASPSFRLSEVEVWGVPTEDDGGDVIEPVEATNVAFGKSLTASRASAGIAPYTDLAIITDGIYFASNSNNQYITYGPSLICLDLEGKYSVSKLVIDAVTTNFTKDLDVYVSGSPMSGTAVPSGATKVLNGDANGWAESIKTVELDTAVDGRYVILHMTSNASPSFRLSEVEVWGVPAEDDGGDGGEGGGDSGDGGEGGGGDDSSDDSSDASTYVSVTDNATSHKSSATATATSYETDSNNYLVDGNPSTFYGTGPAADAYFTFVDLGEGGRRVDKVVITANDAFDRTRGQKYYLANTVPVAGADRSGWVYLGERTQNSVAMTFVLTPEQAGIYRYVVADCTSSTVGGYVNEIEAYMDIDAYLTEEGKPYILTDKTSSVSANAISYSGSLINGSGTRTIVGLFGTRGTDGEYVETAYDQATATGSGSHNIEMSATVTTNGVWDAIFISGLDFVKGFSNLANRTAILPKSNATGITPVLSRVGNTVTLTGKATGSIVGVVVLKPGASFDSYTDADIVAHRVIYAPQSATGAWDFVLDYTFDASLATGDYTMGLFCDNGDSAISGKTNAAEKLNLDAVVDAFEGVTEDNFEDLVEANSVFFGDTADLLTGSDTMAESFMLAKDAVEQGLFDESITAWDVDALVATAKAAIVVDETLNNSDFAETIAPYIGSMPDVFGEDYDAEEFEQIFPAVLDDTEIETAEALVDAYEKANVLSLIANGTTKEIEKAIKENRELLGISDSTMKNVTALQVAKKLDNKIKTVIDSYVDGMDSVVEKIAKEINSVSGGKVLGGGGSGSGGGGGGGFVASVPSNLPEVTKQEEVVSGGTTVAPGTYTDIAGYAWALDAIMTLSERGIISGKGNGVFDPEGRLTREEAVKLLVTTTGTPTDESYNGYDDCVIGSWYYPYITAAKINNLVTGFSRTQFGLGSAVTREDLAVMIYRAMQKQSLVKAVDGASFTDEAQIADYAKEAVSVLGGMGIITGFEDGSFAPTANATRAEAAVIFARYLELSENTTEEGTE